MNFLEDDERLETARLRLELAAPDDSAVAAPWLAAALKPEWRSADLKHWLDSGKAVAIRDRGQELMGLAIVVLDRPVEHGATILFLVVEPERRYRGLGGEAAIAIDRRLRQRGYRQVFAPVPDTRGLAVYFWLRLGFRPLLRQDALWPLFGLGAEQPTGIWMLCDRD